VVPQHPVDKAKYPFIDVHNHQRGGTPERIEELIRDMDRINMRIMVNLSGGSGESLADREGLLPLMATGSPCSPTWISPASMSPTIERIAAQFEQDVRNGARGLKIFKNFGMTSKIRRGREIPVTTRVSI
jgi:hypothetical protein